MTPTEFAESHGLSLEEATYILSRRAALARLWLTELLVDQAG